MHDWLSINGDVPVLRGKVLEELQVQSLWYAGSLEEEAYVTYLKVDGTWHRLYFENGIIFWRPETKGPEPHNSTDDDGTESSFPVIDLGRDKRLSGQRIVECRMEPISDGSRVEFQFAQGDIVAFENTHDVTSVRV